MEKAVYLIHKNLSLTGLIVDTPCGRDINNLSDRAAMGLSDVHPDIDANDLRDNVAKLMGSSPQVLAELVEDAERNFWERLAAGQLLGLLGDPRIDPLNPMMLDVPGGRYRLGLSTDAIDSVMAEFDIYGVLREWIEKESPQYEADICDFRIAKYPVTHAEYHFFVRDTGYTSLPSAWQFGVYPYSYSNHPVYTIAPEDADQYTAWLRQKTSRNFRLPTEAEWEFAAAGPDGKTYPWGNEFLSDHANTVESGLLFSTPVGTFPAGASQFGCMDMAGNVEEYMADNYRPYHGGVCVKDNLLEATGNYRVARGGSFTRYRDLARCKRRHGWFKKPIYIMGFRLAESL